MPKLIRDKNFSMAHNYTIVNIEDKSQVADISAIPNSPMIFMPIVASKGVSRKYVKFDQSSAYADFISMFGHGTMKNNGQGYMSLERHLKNGGRAIVCRVVSDDDTIANTVISMGIKIIEEQQELADGSLVFIDEKTGRDTTDKDGGKNRAKMVKKAVVKTKYESVAQIKSHFDIQEFMQKRQGVSSADGFKWYDAFAILAKGTGKFGNAFEFELENIKEIGAKFPMYKLHVITDGPTGKEVLETFELSSTPGVAREGLSVDIEDVITKYSEYLDVVVCENFQDNLEREIHEVIEDNSNIGATMENFYWYIKPLNGDLQSWIIFDKVDPDYEALDTPVELRGGTTKWKGVFDFNGPDGKEIAGEFSKTFSGEVSDDIYNTTLFPVDYILDANFPTGLKKDIMAFIQKRFDISYIMDMNTNVTNEAMMMVKLDSFDRDNYNIVTIPYAYRKYRETDDSVAKDITLNHIWNDSFVKHWNLKGYDKPFAGTNVTLPIEKDRLYPICDFNKLAEKKAIYINYYKDTLYLDSQVTSQHITSQLSEFMNVLILNRIIKDMIEVIETYKHTIDRVKDIKELQDRGNTVLARYSSMLHSYNYTVGFASQYEGRKGILTDNLELTFNGTIKKNRFNISILPKIYPITGGKS